MPSGEKTLHGIGLESNLLQAADKTSWLIGLRLDRIFSFACTLPLVVVPAISQVVTGHYGFWTPPSHCDNDLSMPTPRVDEQLPPR